MKTLISVSTLKSQMQGERPLLVIDARFSLQDAGAGRKAYDSAHISTAVFLDMEQDLSAAHVPGVTGRHPLPDRTQWMQLMQQKLGLQPETQVVVYDDAGGAGAARVWWLLRWGGHARVAVLDGGWQAWLEEGGSTETAVHSPQSSRTDYSALPTLTRLVTATDLDVSRQNLVDAREHGRFEGRMEPIDPVAGHIPGAVCLPFSGNLDEQGRFRPVTELQQRFADLDPAKEVACYCGSGVTACHNILAMVHAGFAEPALYAGSWSEWITNPSRPVATGP